MSKIVFSVFLSLALIGCTMNNISGHDADIEKGLTEVGKKADTLFVSLENTANTPSDCSYEKNKKSYGEIDIELRAVEVRADALEKDTEKYTFKQVKSLEKILNLIKTAHQKGCLSLYDIEDYRTKMLKGVSEALKTELSKKQITQ